MVGPFAGHARTRPHCQCVQVRDWGWIHLTVGLLVLVAGFFVFNGAVWARVVGIAAAALSAVLNFMWLPYYPVWGLIIIALDMTVIWALSVHGREFTR